MLTIHELIRDRREAKGWSQQDLADRVSEREGLARPLTWQTVQQWEKKTAPKRKRVQIVAELLGIPPNAFVGGDASALSSRALGVAALLDALGPADSPAFLEAYVLCQESIARVAKRYEPTATPPDEATPRPRRRRKTPS